MKVYPIYSDNKTISGCKFVGGVYLHGTIQDISKYDLIQMPESDIEILTNTDCAKFDVDVIFSDNSSKPCILYFWQDFDAVFQRNIFRGLIVDKEDKVSIADAERKFKAKPFWL